MPEYIFSFGPMTSGYLDSNMGFPPDTFSVLITGGGQVRITSTIALSPTQLVRLEALVSDCLVQPIPGPIIFPDLTVQETAGSPVVHSHPEADVTNLVSDLAGKSPVGHGHAESDVSGLVADLAGKASIVHGHAEGDVSGLIADLLARNASQSKFRPSGRYHTNQFIAGTAVNLALAGNQLYAVPFFMADGHTILKMAVHCTTAKAGSAARLGIYADNGSAYPGALVLDAGTVATIATGLKESTGLTSVLASNSLYWLVVVSNSNPSVAAVNSPDAFPLLGYDGALNIIPFNSYQVAFAYAALPAAFPAGAAAVNTDRAKIALQW